MKLPKHSKTIRKYILSYTGIALLSCALVGLVLFALSARELDRAYREARQEKLENAVEFLDNNLELMREVTYKLQMSYYFRTEYLIQNGYNPAVTLEYLTRFKSYVPLSEEYFLMYTNSDKVYKVADTSATNDFYVFAKRVLGVEKYEGLYERIKSTTKFQVIVPEEEERKASGDNYAAGEFILFMFPIKFSEHYRDSAVFGFVVRPQNVLRHIEGIVDDADGEIYIYCADKLVASTTGGEPQDGLNYTMVSSADGQTTLILLPSEPAAYMRMMNLNGAVYLYFAAIVAVMFILALLTAYHTYRPIGELVQRYHPNALAQGDELTTLSRMIEEIFEEKRVSTDRLRSEMELLAKQRIAIRRQIVQLLICGQFDARIRENLQYLDFPTEDCVYAVLVACAASGMPIDAEPLISAMEELSDETLGVYGVAFAGGECVAFLCISKEAEGVSEVKELAEAVAVEMGIHLRCGLGLIGDTLSRIPISFLDALSRIRGEQPSDANPARGTDMQVKRLSYELENGNQEQAERCLTQILAKAAETAQPFSKMCIFSDVIHVLMRIAYKYELNFGDEKLNIVAIMQDTDSFRTLALELIDQICKKVEHVDSTKNAALCDALLEYIRANVADYDMNPETLAHQFSLPEKNITRIIREATGLSYKEYLNEARVARACELLIMEDKSVAETCALVGLSEVSYFIRVFKKITGETPANYKRRAAPEGRSADEGEGVL